MVHLPAHETNYFYITFKLRWHRGDMGKILKIPLLLRGHAVAITCARNNVCYGIYNKIISIRSITQTRNQPI